MSKILIDRDLLEELRDCATVCAHTETNSVQRANWYLGTARRAEGALAAPQQEPVGEEVEVVMWVHPAGDIEWNHKPWMGPEWQPVMTVAQCQRIVAGLKATITERNENYERGNKIRSKAIRDLTAERDQLKADKDHLIQQAQIQAQEARTQRSTVLEIGELVGCHNDWEMAGAVRSFIDQLKAEVERLKSDYNDACEDAMDAARNGREVEQALRALLAAQTVVMPEPRFQRVAWDYADGWNDCLDEVQRLNKGASHE